MKIWTRFLALLGFGAVAPFASAQWDNFEGVVAYEYPEYGGATLTLYPGEAIPRLRDYRFGSKTWNDRISSLAVYGNVVVYLYEHHNYGGQVLALTEHTPSLAIPGLLFWNNEVSSIYVDYYHPEGWIYDEALQSWVFWDNGWIYHDRGLGWLYGAYWDRSWNEGWLYDLNYGWVYTSAASFPWLSSWDWGDLMFLDGTSAPRWFYSPTYGWITG